MQLNLGVRPHAAVVPAQPLAASVGGRPIWALGDGRAGVVVPEGDAPEVTTTPNWSRTPHYGFGDASWALSRSGRLTLLAQAVDYDGAVRRVYASPPSLIVDLPGQARRQAVVFGRVPDAGPRANWPGARERVGQPSTVFPLVDPTPLTHAARTLPD